MLQVKEISEVVGLKVYVEDGEFFGNVEGALIEGNKISSWRIKATRESFLNKSLSGAKGAVVPHQLVKAVGDIVIVRKGAAPSYTEE